MSDDAVKDTTATEEEEKAKRRAQAERYRQTMWTYICGAIALLCNVVGLEATFIPAGFGVLGSILAWQLMQKGEKRHSAIAGAINLGSILIWLTYNWPLIRHYLGG
jgi:hypothetical protein